MIRLKKVLLTGTATAIGCAGFSAGATAQDAAIGVDQATEVETAASRDADGAIVVTGSRIRRSNENSAIPLQILGVEDITETGSGDISDILTEIPGVDSSLSPESTSLSTQNAGLSTINLRRLGGDRTLTLINGRRAVSNSGNGERIDLLTIPAGFVERVEVTSGGASAIYGSDAIAGVVNILLEDDQEGFEISGTYSKAEASGERSYTIDTSYGTRFANDRGYFLAAFSYDKESAILADATRPGSIANVEFNRPNQSRLAGEGDNPDAFGSEIGFGDCDNSGRFCINPSGSSNLPGGLFEGDDAWNVGGVWFNDRSLLPADGRLGSFGFETDVDGFNFRPGRTISPETERFVGGVRSEFDITPSITLSAYLTFSQIETQTLNAANAASNTTDIGFNNALGDIGTISSSHPFIPPEVEETRSGSVSWRRRFTEVGMDERNNRRQTLRSAVGLEGYVGDDWQWNLEATFGTYDQRQITQNDLNYLNIRNALDVETVGGVVQCADATARADGCVPLNIFGEGSVSAEAADYIRYSAVLRQEREQLTFGGSMNGDLLQLPAGPVKAAFGFSYRDEYQMTDGDDDNNLELTSVAPIPDIEASFDVVEIFGELDIPIIEDMLSLQLAARGADYSTVGTVFSYNIGGSFHPSRDIRFRAQYSRSQRAPTLTEFFSPARGDFDSLRDPCDGLMPDGSGITPAAGSSASAAVISTNCLSEPGIQAFFADPANAGNAFEFDGSVSGPNAGNNTLQEETADTFTAGVVLTPSFIPNLSIIVDYYNITVKDAIGLVSTQLTADLCYSDPNFPANRFCSVITRDASSGSVQQIINREENLNQLKAEGFEVSLDYEIEPGFIPGEFDISLRYNHYIKDSFTFLSLDGPQTEDSLGLIGASQDEFRARLSYDISDFTLSWTTVYRSGGVDDLDVLPTDNAYFRAESEYQHRLFTSYRFGEDNQFRIFAGINNVFDKIGPLVPSGLDNGNSRNIVSALNDPQGREFFVGARARF